MQMTYRLHVDVVLILGNFVNGNYFLYNAKRRYV